MATADPLSFDTVLLEFAEEAIVDDVYLSPATYSIDVVEGVGAVAIRRILVPRDAKSTAQVILVVDKPQSGTHYRVTINGLNGRTGGGISGTTDFIGRETKTGRMIRKLPAHFDKAPESVVSAILTAVGIEDDAIGGSRSDRFTATQNVLLLEDGSPLQLEDADTILLEP